MRCLPEIGDVLRVTATFGRFQEQKVGQTSSEYGLSTTRLSMIFQPGGKMRQSIVFRKNPHSDEAFTGHIRIPHRHLRGVDGRVLSFIAKLGPHDD